jgi:hypothetical protein
MITIRPETAGSLLVIEASGKLTRKDYEDIFIPKLNELIEKFQKLRVVFYLNDSFDGWELGAMWDDAKFGLAHKNDFARIAVVGAPRWVNWLMKLSAPLMSGELRIFDRDRLEEALIWMESQSNGD